MIHPTEEQKNRSLSFCSLQNCIQLFSFCFKYYFISPWSILIRFLLNNRCSKRIQTHRYYRSYRNIYIRILYIFWMHNVFCLLFGVDNFDKGEIYICCAHPYLYVKYANLVYTCPAPMLIRYFPKFAYMKWIFIWFFFRVSVCVFVYV